MLISKTAKVKIGNRNIKHYKMLGYEVSSGDIIEVIIKHITLGSKAKVDVECDGQCGNVLTITYANYVISMKNNNKILQDGYYCKKCYQKIAFSGNNNPMKNKKIAKKSKELRKKSLFEKYGTTNLHEISGFKEKRNRTLIEKYGTTNMYEIPGVSEKMATTLLNKYGVHNTWDIPGVKEKSKKTKKL